MKRSKGLLILSLLAAVFFLLFALAELFYSLGKDKVPQKALPPLRLAMKLFPLPGDYYGEAGFSLMEKGMRGDDAATMKASIPFLKKAISRNPLDHRSHYYLAKAYLRLSSVGSDYFDLGVAELRRAAVIRGSNKEIALECVKVYFSLWPLLEKEDQEFASGLLARAMPSFSWEEFRALVEMWALYVQDDSLLQAVLAKRPDFYGPAADQLVAAGIPLSWRWKLLDQYEQYSLETTWRLYNESLLSNKMDGEQAQNLLNHLRIRGYFRLLPASQLSTEKLGNLQRQLQLAVISGALSEGEWTINAAKAFRLKADIQRYTAEHDTLSSFDELHKLLEEKGFFKDNDFSTLRLKALISYKKGDYGGVIAEVEALRKGISFVKKEQAADYTDILLMLVDSYYSSKLMTAAEAVAAELLREQPDNPDILWRVLRVQKIMGVEGTPDPALQEKLVKVENSRFIAITKQNKAFDIFLFNEPQVEITFDPTLLASLKPQQLIQVFVDNKIAFESYVEGLPEKVVIGAPFVGIESKAKVQIVIL